MRVVAADLYPVTVPAAGGPGANTSVVLRLRTDEGIEGIADTGNTSAWYRGETQDSIIGILAEAIAPYALLGRDPMALERIAADIDYLVRDNFQAKMLVDVALLDLVGKALGIPVYQLLGGRGVDRVAIGYVSAERDPGRLAETAAGAVAAGYGLVKVKVALAGTTLADDVARIAAVRSAVGDDIDIDIDANGGWTYKQALEAIDRLAPFSPGLFEQPVPARDVGGMARLRQRCEIPVYADEAAQEPPDLIELTRRGAVDGFLLKPAKAGGLLRGKRWIAVAQACGLPVVIGSMAGSGVEAAAHLHLAVATAWTDGSRHEICGPLRTHGIFETGGEAVTTDLAAELPRYEGGYAWPPPGPGLGVTLNERLLPRLVSPGRRPVTLTDAASGRHDGYRVATPA